MRRIIAPLFILTLISFCFSSCNSGGGIETSAEMNDFMEMFDGKDGSVQAAVKKHAVSALQDQDNEITWYILENPEVTAREGDCYTMEATGGIVVRVYKICWENNKINTIDFIEMK